MTELEYWTNQIKKGRISRREFIGRAAALGVTTALGSAQLLLDLLLGRVPAIDPAPYAPARMSA